MTDQQPDFYEDLVHELQYGEPSSAAQKLRQLDQQRAANRKYEDELSKSQAELARFEKANKDISDDPFMSAATERAVYDSYLVDLRAAGFQDNQLPRDLNSLAGLHLRLRAEQKARPIAKVFEQAARDVREWKRTGKHPTPQGAAPSGNAFQDPLVTGLPLGLVGRDGDEPDVGRSRAVEMMRRNREGLRNPTASTLHRPIERPAWEGSE